MSVTKIYSDQSRQVNWNVREDTDASLTLTVTLASVAYNLSSYTFIAEFFKVSDRVTPFLTLNQGSGITNGGASGIITISLTDTQLNLDPNEYFWKLRTTAPTDNLWLNGKFVVNGYLWDGSTDSSANILLTIGGDNLSIALTIAGSSGGTVTGASNGIYLSSSTVKLGTNPLLENTIITRAGCRFGLGNPDTEVTYVELNGSGNTSDVLNLITAGTLTIQSSKGVWGLTTVGGNFFGLADGSSVGWTRINADNTVTKLTANNTLNAILPSQTSNSGKFLTTDGTNTSWATSSGGITGSGVANQVAYWTSSSAIGGIGGTDGQLLRMTGSTLSFGNNDLNSLTLKASSVLEVASGTLGIGTTSGTTLNLGTYASNTNINIGTAGTNTIQIGNANSTVNILGTVLYENVTNLQVTDKLITINKGGAAASATGTGLEVEENSAISAYFKTTGGRDGWLLKAPSITNDISFLFTNISGARSYALPNASGTIAISASGNIALNATTGDITFTGVLPAASGGAGTVNGILKANGSGVVSAAVSNTDYLAVANPAYTGVLTTGTLSYSDTGILAYFQSSTNSYNQLIIQNTNAGATASTNINVSNDQGTATTNYGEFGMNSSGFTGSPIFSQPGYVYLASASTDLVIGTYASKPIHFVVNSGTADSVTITAAGNTIFTSPVTTGSGATAGHQIVGNSLTTGNLIDASSSSVTTGNLLALTSTSTAANAFSLLNLNSSGANANSSRTAIGATISVTNSGTSSTNKGLVITTSGATTNTALTTTGGLSFTSNTASDITATGTWTATADAQFHANLTASITGRASQATDLVYGYKITPAFTAGSGGNGEAIPLYVSATYSGTFGTTYIAKFEAASTANTSLRLLIRNTTSGSSASSDLYFGNNSGSAGAFLGFGSSAYGSYAGAAGLSLINLSNGSLVLGTNNAIRFNINASGNTTYTATASASGGTMSTWTQPAATGGTANLFLVTAGAHTTQTANVEITDINFNLARVVKIATGTVATQRAFRIQGPTYTPQSSTLTLTDAATLEVETITAGASTTITRNWNTRFVGTGFVGVGGMLYAGSTSVAPTAFVTVVAGTTAAAQLRLLPGVAPTSPNDGDHWYEDTNDRLMFYKNATSCEILSASAVNSVSPTSPNRTITITHNGTTYYIAAKTTND